MLTILLNCAASLVQTIPPYPTLVCPGGRLVLTCTADNSQVEVLVWRGDSGTEGQIGRNDNPITVDSFNVTVAVVNGVTVSTAINESVPVQLNGTSISCSDDIGESYATLIINVTGMLSIIINIAMIIII